MIVAAGVGTGRYNKSASGEERVGRQQFAFNYCELSVNHSKRFDSPQRVKAKCFAEFASSLGSREFSSVPMSTNNAAAVFSPARQITSTSASTFSWFESS